MNHAILIMAYNNPELIEYNIRLLDDSNIDFYIHIDKKSCIDNFLYLSQCSKKSKVKIIQQYKIYWGGENQIKAELLLFKNSFENQYDYYHLISGQDLCIKTKKEFFNSFTNSYVNYIKIEKKAEGKILDRVKYYHPLSQTTFSRHKAGWLIGRVITIFQKALCINRCKGQNIFFGENWCSVTNEFVEYLLRKEKEGFISKYFFCAGNADELYKQTIFMEWIDIKKNKKLLGDNSKRYVDWSFGGASPKFLNIEDYGKLLDSNAIFARKFNLNNGLAKLLYNYLVNKK